MKIKNKLFKQNNENSINKREVSNLILYLAGKLVSIFGTAIYTFALGLYVLKETGSGLSFAATLAVGVIPMILINPFAGVIADRFDKKKIIVSMDMLNGILLVGLYFISVLYRLEIMMIYLTTFMMTVFTCFFDISMEAAKPTIVSDKKLLSINSVSKVIDSVSSILGPMIGGMVFAFVDIKTFILINGLSFIFSAISEMFIDFKFNNNNCNEKILEIRERIHFIKEIKEGFEYLKKRKDIISLLSIFVSLNFFLGFAISIPLPYIINNVIKLTSTQFGITEGAFPVGMIIGALLIEKVLQKISYINLLRFVSYILGFCMIMVGIPVLFINFECNSIIYLMYYCIVIVTFGIALSFVDIPVMVIFQKLVPEEYRGRVLSIVVSTAKTMLPLALILSGVLINKLPAYILPMGGGILLFAFMILALKGNDLKEKRIG